MITIKRKKIEDKNGSFFEFPYIVDTFELEYYIHKKIGNFLYPIKKFFKPWNVIRLRQLPNEYTDRDHVMFHCIFQCLVDFVELEHDLVPWDLRRDLKGRFTDINVMYNYILSNLTPEGLASYHSSWDDEAEKLRTDIRTKETMVIKTEILYLYAWYKAERYELNSELILHVDLEDIARALGFFDETRPKKEYYITNSEHTEIEAEHDLVCDNMLKRVLAIRRYLWT